MATAFLLAAAAPQLAWAGGTPATGTTSDQLLMITGSESQTSDGDYLTARDGLATTHRYFVEVPATATRFRLDLFDMDLLMGGAADRTGERDRPRVYPSFDPNDLGTYGSELFMSVVEYRLFDPDGTAVVAKRRKGSRWAPDGGDNAWLTLYDSNTADTSAAADTWRDTFTVSSYSNNNGTQSFATSWIESNETGTNSVAGPGGGLISVTAGVLRMNNLLTPFPPYTGRQPGVERELNLSGYTSATLSFTYAVPSNNEKDDILVVELSNDGGANWTVVDDVTGGIHGIAVAATSRIYDISEFISANTRIRFRLAYLFAGANERVDIDNFEIRATTAAPAALKTGHWELRVDMSKALTQNVAVQNGDETNAYGIRASDGDTSTGGREFNVYSSINTSGLDDNDSTRSYRLYPLLTSGCDFDAANFDWDANLAANVAADPDINPPFGTFTITGRETAFTHTLTTLSDNDAWYSENVTNFTDQDDATNYGLWQADFRIDDPGDGNYVPHYYMDYDAATVTPPSSSAPADALRNYFPNDAGTAPGKPYLRQFVRFHNVQPSGASEPPLVGQTARYVIYLQVVNPSGSTGSITFSPTRTVTSRFPGGTMTYRGVALMTQGSIVSQPALGSNTAADLVWNPGVVTAGAGGIDNVAQLSYEVDFTPTSSPYLVDFVGAPGSGNGTRATWLDETGYDVVGSRSIFSTGELCQLWEQFDDPTPVLVSAFRGWRKNGQTVVEWRTSAEAKTTSFDLYRAEGRNRVKVNGATLSALLASPQGGTYRLLDPGVPAPGAPAAGADYWLVAHDSDGKSQTHGPYRVVASEELAAPIYGDYTVAAHQPSARHLAYQPPPAPSAAAGPERGAATALLLETTERGLYRVGRETLQSSFGLDAARLDGFLVGGGFALERGGDAVAWTPAPGHAGLDFFAPGFDDAYTGADVFRLSLGDGLQMKKIDGKAVPPDWPGGGFRDTRHAEQNLRPVVLLPLDPQGDFFFWDFVRHGTAAETRSFAFTLPAPAAGGGPARLLLDLQGGSAGDHLLEISLNGTPVGVAELSGTSASRAELAVDRALLLAGANSLTVRSAAGDLVFVEAFDLEYDRAYRAASGQLISRPDGKSLLAAAGFSRPEIRVFDLADPLRPRQVYATRVLAEGAGYRAIWRPLGPNDQLAVDESGVLTPATRLDLPSELKLSSNQADYLVIATAALAPAARNLADLRAARGLAAQVVLLEDIYDEFAFGRRDPRAIRDFLAHAHANWAIPPRYVVLAGHGTYDYRDFLGYHNNLIPSLMWRAGDSLYPTDALYADFLGGDGVPELALGRLPVLTAGELEAYVLKLEAYEALGTAAWQSQVLMLSDQSGPGGDFLADSRALAPLLPAGYVPTEIALDNIDVATARAQLFAALSSGAALVHYAGHGAVDRFSSASLLTSGDVPALGNGGRPTVVSAVTCHVGFHALPTFDSLGEELVLHPTGGAVAVFAPTWLAENYDSLYLGDRLFRRLFATPGVLVGDAVAGTLGAGAAQNIDRDLLYAYQLLGDPALLFVAHPEPPPPGCSENCGDG